MAVVGSERRHKERYAYDALNQDEVPPEFKIAATAESRLETSDTRQGSPQGNGPPCSSVVVSSPS
ncbi:MAG: hypothetical protein IPJ17_07085 [Holophagales bacterium]|nr:MAG: hypothetical protein IPJ17_07085 [Holophagales bacterium]